MIKTLALVLCILFVASDQCNTFPKRIKVVRGSKLFRHSKIVPAKEIDISSVPFLVLVEFMENQICAGSILSEKFVLTAADCTARYVVEYLSIRYGTDRLNEGGTTVKLSNVFVHPDFDYLYLRYDISVIELAEDIKFSKTAKPITLNGNLPIAGEEGLVPGWDTLMMDGEYLSNKLKLVSVRVHNYEECHKTYLHPPGRSILCAKALMGCQNATALNPMCEGDCHGDRGGPLVINSTLSGVVSWGLGCGPATLRAYSNVANLRSFIDRSTSGSAKWMYKRSTWIQLWL